MSLDQRLVKDFVTPWKLRLWMLKSLPMGLLSGMYIQSLDDEGCVVVLKARWWLRNPFGSVFWAVMGMAAELSTGALVYAYAREKGIKFILVGMEASFFRKVKGKSSYFCHNGSDVLQGLGELINPHDAIVVNLPVTAKDEDGQLLAEFRFQWQLRKPMD